ncbi:hypothetical protein P872_04900 [Rhodonellum psychrophilum GCM71 = DSM 17998]|uniref:Uracil-DNA glycosylase-like domain-containing protein n=2 Tax=Rhodonellum TaxID=336827 RepID=U5BZH4_9BACT|nr:MULTISPECIES: hypothetical protein [Rhodonellum]ERM82954.1 hypothetical protein P872_04900 [Rhodonellum psychrophilum GCM71 = DSM 17998]SDZ36646.1 hypothetical protein SAMN05444412_111122 [Rhodonellum ikkaensis]
MEELSLFELGLFLDNEIVVLKEEGTFSKSKGHPASDSSLKGTNVAHASQPEEVEIEMEMELVHEGNFEKGILIVYQGDHLESTHREFLFKILQAVNCSLKDIALSSSEMVEETKLSSIQQMNPNKILIFGKLRHDLMKIMQHKYEILNEDGVEYFFADDLREISENVELKRSLWNKLQILFGIKK